MSINTIESGLWLIKSYMMRKYGCDAADREFEPLEWYVTTGRASVTFLKGLFSLKPYVVARILHKGGSSEEAIARIKRKVGA